MFLIKSKILSLKSNLFNLKVQGLLQYSKCSWFWAKSHKQFSDSVQNISLKPLRDLLSKDRYHTHSCTKPQEPTLHKQMLIFFSFSAQVGRWIRGTGWTILRLQPWTRKVRRGASLCSSTPSLRSTTPIISSLKKKIVHSF